MSREIDKLIAEHVFGLKNTCSECGEELTDFDSCDEEGRTI